MACLDSRGEIVFSPFYVDAHLLPSPNFTFLGLSTTSGHTVFVSPGHYIFVFVGGCTSLAPTLLTALSVGYGDGLLLTSGLCSAVANITSTVLQGHSSPYTLEGTIFINGIAASVYSDPIYPPHQMHWHALTFFARTFFSIFSVLPQPLYELSFKLSEFAMMNFLPGK